MYMRRAIGCVVGGSRGEGGPSTYGRTSAVIESEGLEVVIEGMSDGVLGDGEVRRPMAQESSSIGVSGRQADTVEKVSKDQSIITVMHDITCNRRRRG